MSRWTRVLMVLANLVAAAAFAWPLIVPALRPAAVKSMRAPGRR